MKGKNSFVLYKSWRSYFELLEEPELITELVYAIFDLADGKEISVTNNRVRSALKAIEPKMKEDLERFKAKGWKDFYPKGENKCSVRMRTGEEAGITCEPENEVTSTTSESEECSIPGDILDMFGENGENDS